MFEEQRKLSLQEYETHDIASTGILQYPIFPHWGKKLVQFLNNNSAGHQPVWGGSLLQEVLAGVVNLPIRCCLCGGGY